MARILIDGIDGLMGDLNKAGSSLRPIIEEALIASAQELQAELLRQERRFKHPTYELGNTLAITRVGHGPSASLIDVYYKGDYYGARAGGELEGQHAPRRAGFVAAMQEYKNKRPFNRRARRNAAPRVNSIITEAMGHVNKKMFVW